jgi:hypothetical protein
MDDRMLSSVVLVGLSVTFGSYGIWTLIAAYRAANSTTWSTLAILGGISVLLSAALGKVATELIAEMSQTRSG